MVSRLVAAIFLLAGAPLARGQQDAAAAAEDALIGIWSYETRFGSAHSGELNVGRRGSGWRATFAGSQVRFTAAPGDITFRFPGEVGSYRGMFVDDDEPIRGHWLRRAATCDPRFPGGASQPYASPVVLEPDGPDAWRGKVEPLPDSFTLYLRIFRDADGAVLGAFRNPEQNARGGAAQFRVTRAGNQVTFRAQPDPSVPELRIEARFAAAPDRLRMFWGGLEREIELARRAPAEVAAYFPRPPDSPPYAYGPPPALEDGWPVARAQDVGIDEAVVTRMVQGIVEADPAAPRPSLIHSMLIARGGKLVLEEYFFGHDRETPHDLRSAGKSFSSVLMGVAMKTGTTISPETRVYELLDGMGPFANPDPRKSKITLAHLMTHTSGLACNDNDDASPGNENTMQIQTGQPDWWMYTLDLPMAYEPGTRYAYCSANVNLMGAVLKQATGGSWLPALFERHVARPLQFGAYHWNLMPNDEGYLGGGAFILPRDFLKVGQLYLDGGTWKGQRILDAAWVEQSTAPHVKISPATTGLAPEEFSNSYFGGEDAYAWHLNNLRSGERVIPAYAATGNGGQLLIVVPEYELVAVFTGGNYMQGGIWGRWGDQFIAGQVIPAIDAASSRYNTR